MQTFKVDSCLLQDLTFTPDGRRLLVGSPTRVLFDTLGLEAPRALKPPTGAFTAYAQLALDNRVLIYTTPTDNDHIHAWDFEADEVRVWPHAGQHVKDLTISPDGKTLYAVSAAGPGGAWATDLRAFDVATGEVKMAFMRRTGYFSWLSMSADGRFLAGRSSWTAGVWNLTAPDVFVELRLGKLRAHVQGVALSADGSRLAAISSRGVRLLDLTSEGVPRDVFSSGKHRRGVEAVACCPRRPLLATGDNAGQVFLWDHDGRVLHRYDWGLAQVQALAFAPDGLRCAAADEQGKVVVWDMDV